MDKDTCRTASGLFALFCLPPLFTLFKNKSFYFSLRLPGQQAPSVMGKQVTTAARAELLASNHVQEPPHGQRSSEGCALLMHRAVRESLLVWFG